MNTTTMSEQNTKTQPVHGRDWISRSPRLLRFFDVGATPVALFFGACRRD